MKQKNLPLITNSFPSPVNTRFPSPLTAQSTLTNEEKIAFISDRFREIIQALGLDLTDESIAKTPDRIAKMYVNEIFSGLDPNSFPSITFVKNQMQNKEQTGTVFVSLSLSSFCEHHFVPIIGTAYVAYIPKEKIIGLSKIHRIVRFFAKRPQLQERLTSQIADSLSLLLETEDVAVSITAQHFCVAARGVEDEDSLMTTHVLRGAFQDDPSRRNEFFVLVDKKK